MADKPTHCHINTAAFRCRPSTFVNVRKRLLSIVIVANLPLQVILAENLHPLCVGVRLFKRHLRCLLQLAVQICVVVYAVLPPVVRTTQPTGQTVPG
jgi:hypothetical protein